MSQMKDLFKTKASVGLIGSSKASKSATITRILVDLDRQKLYAYAGSVLVYEFHAVTGRKGKETDIGRHRIFRKEKTYTSKTYKVPMNYAMFFTSDGKAIHHSSAGWVTLRSFGKALGAEQLGVTVGSHGCVGISEEDAKALFERTPLNTIVEIVPSVSAAKKGNDSKLDGSAKTLDKTGGLLKKPR